MGRLQRPFLNIIGWGTFHDYNLWWELHAPRITGNNILPYSSEDQVVRALRGDVAVDIGAYKGYFTIQLARRFNHVIAFEPHPHNRKVLESNTRNFRNVSCRQMAISDREGSISFYFGQDSSMHSIDSSFALGNGHYIKVPTTSLSKALSNMNTDFSLDLVKVDVEGAEFHVLAGAKEIIQHIRRWLIEVHSNNESQQRERCKRMQELLQKEGYKIRWIDQRHIYAYRPQPT